MAKARKLTKGKGRGRVKDSEGVKQDGGAAVIAGPTAQGPCWVYWWATAYPTTGTTNYSTISSQTSSTSESADPDPTPVPSRPTNRKIRKRSAHHQKHRDGARKARGRDHHVRSDVLRKVPRGKRNSKQDRYG